MILQSARPNTRPARVAPRNEHEKDRAAGNAPLPPSSLRAAECSRDTETNRCPQIRLDGNEGCPAAGLAEQVGHNCRSKLHDRVAPSLTRGRSRESHYRQSTENMQSQF